AWFTHFVPVFLGMSWSRLGFSLGYLDTGNSIPVRGDPHVLVVGDPGLGKSQMLTACAKVAPRGVFVTGNTTTTAGLTVTLSKDGSNDFTLEAGALILADQGHCCIDEFDKMQGQHHSRQCPWPRVVWFARFRLEQLFWPLRIPLGDTMIAHEHPALLSRFDIVFILIDRPDEHLDHCIGKQSRGISLSPPYASQTETLDSLDQNNNLKSRLKARMGKTQQIAPSLLRKYIAYARRYVFPKLTT
ncbi:DNA helicase MCM8, partial [Caligus rogercresseyi]